MTRPSPPSNLSVSQNGLNSVLVSWEPSYGADYYTIYYMYQNDFDRSSRRSQRANADDTTITLLLSIGYSYSISITANTAVISSTEAGPVIIIIDSLTIRMYRSAADFDLYNGQVVKLTCRVTLHGELTETPTFSWQGPGLLPTPVVSFSRPLVVSGSIVYAGPYVGTSDLIFDSINSSNEGRYTCTAGLDNFPFTVEDYEDIYINTELRLSLNLQIEVHNTQPLQFTLTCVSTGGPAAYVSWMRGSEDIEGGMTILEDYRLYKHTLNGTEEGIYTCTVSNDTPDTATATLNVTISRPTVTISVDPPDDLDVGSSVVFTCMATLDHNVDSLASVTFSWKGPRLNSGGHYSVVESGFGLNYNSSLTISDVANEDEGEYACIVRVSGSRSFLPATVTESTSINVLGKTCTHNFALLLCILYS
jgi:hypothetical protein